MELLAPAGNVENFYAALEAGADAVYVGAPGFNARNLSRDLRLDEIGAMIGHCRREDKKIYIAANSLLLEKELPRVIDTLAALEYLQPDALIVQDLGIINLLKYYFPGLKYHASTLMGAHNLGAVQTYGDLGCERVVLARELTVDEIVWISSKTDIELEVFIHGAMCFSYSGLCLFSSYLGGKSGLRGRCVQPCRRSYGQKSQGGPARKKGQRAGKGGYLFSMNDLDGLAAVADLRAAGIASLKIEGRLRSAHYVENVVKGYRLLLDTDPEHFAEALPEAEEIIERAMSRKVSSGYFFSPQPPEAITPFHSGNLGLHLGRAAQAGSSTGVKLELKGGVAEGDRLRLHLEPSGDRVSYTLKSLRRQGTEIDRGVAGDHVELGVPADLAGSWKFVDVYKVDVAASRQQRKSLATAGVKKGLDIFFKRHRGAIKEIERKAYSVAHGQERQVGAKPKVRKGGSRGTPHRKGGPVKVPLEWWLKVDSVRGLLTKQVLNPDRYVITMSRQNVSQAGQLKRAMGKQMRNITWALPSILLDKDFAKMRKQLQTLTRAGFRSFQVGHLSQMPLFEGERVFLCGDYSLNLINNQGLLTVAGIGMESAQLAIEADRESLAEAVQGYKQIGVPPTKRGGGRRTMRLGLTVYGAPPLFTSRIDASFFQYDKPVVSPKNEEFVIRKQDGCSVTHPVRPFSLLPYLYDLVSIGIDYVVVDTTAGHGGKKELQEIANRLTGGGKMPKLSTFNYLGKLE